MSRGDYFIFLDADDHLLPLAIETGLEQFVLHSDSGYVVGPHEEMTYHGEPVPWSVATPPAGGGNLYRSLLAFDWYIIPPSSAMFRRQVVEAIGGFQDPWGSDDLDFYLRAAKDFVGWCYESPPVTRYRRYPESSSRDGARMLSSVRAVYERNRRWVAADPELKAAWETGLAKLTAIFSDCLVENLDMRLRDRQWQRAMSTALVLGRESPRRLAAALRAAAHPSAASAAVRPQRNLTPRAKQ